MDNRLDEILESLKNTYQAIIHKNARNYVEADIGKEAGRLGYTDLEKKYSDVYAVIPLKEALRGMKVRIDGRTFVNYVQFESGIAVPGYVAGDIRLPHCRYVPNDSMILNFA